MLTFNQRQVRTELDTIIETIQFTNVAIMRLICARTITNVVWGSYQPLRTAITNQLHRLTFETVYTPVIVDNWACCCDLEVRFLLHECQRLNVLSPIKQVSRDWNTNKEISLDVTYSYLCNILSMYLLGVKWKWTINNSNLLSPWSTWATLAFFLSLELATCLPTLETLSLLLPVTFWPRIPA